MDGNLERILECAVCLEALDETSRVLPCQHTFCKTCLLEIVRFKGELRCPECRIVVRTPVQQLPTNVLLVRLLEGLKSQSAQRASKTGTSQTDTRVPPPKVPCARVTKTVHAASGRDLSVKSGDLIYLKRQLEPGWFLATPWASPNRPGRISSQNLDIIVPLPTTSSSSNRTPPSRPTSRPKCAEQYLAIYAYQHQRQDELSLTRGDVYLVFEKCDDGWFKGVCAKSGRQGFFPGNYVRPVTAPVTQPAVVGRSNQIPVAIVRPSSMATAAITNGASVHTAAVSASQALGVPKKSHSEHAIREMLGESSSNQLSARDTLVQSTVDLGSPRLDSRRRSIATEPTVAVFRRDRLRASFHADERARLDDTVMRAVIASPSTSARDPIPVSLVANMTSATGPKAAMLRFFRIITPAPNGRRQASAGHVASHSPSRGSVLRALRQGRQEQRCVCVTPYPPTSPRELELDVGDVVILQKCRQDGWVKGVQEKTGRAGWFPGSFVQHLD